MITKTSERAVRLLLFIGRQKETKPLAVQEVAQGIGAAQAYTAKIVGGLVQAGVLRSQRGAGGGVGLARPPAEISLLDVVLACQHMDTQTYCRPPAVEGCDVCAFHAAMRELHESIHGVLKRWTLADLLEQPVGRIGEGIHEGCLMMPAAG